MAEDWKDCASNDNEIQKAVSKAQLSDHIANAIVILHAFAMISYGINIILADVDITDPTIEIPHIYRMEVPFNIKKQSTYKFILVIELIHGIVGTWGMGILNALLLTLVSCMCT